MILAYLAVCIPALGPNFCFPEKSADIPFSTEEKCWAYVDTFMAREVKSGGTTVVYHFKCADRA